MSRFEFAPITKELDDETSSTRGHLLPRDCYTLSLAKTNGPFHAEPILRDKPNSKFKDKPIILLPLKPQLDNRRIEAEPKSEPLTADALDKYETHAKRILDWSRDAQVILSKPNPDPGQLTRLRTDCIKGKINESVEALGRSILGTVVPSNMPQLVEPWQDVKTRTREVAHSFSAITNSLTDQKQTAEASRLLQGVVENLNQVLSDGFDRASALSDRLPKKQATNEIAAENNLTPEDQRKADQIKILGAYQTTSYFVSTIESSVSNLSERPYAEMTVSDWVRLERSNRAFQRGMNGLKNEFNVATMKMLENNNELTGSQKQLLKNFRQSIEQVLPALQSLEISSPVQDKKFTPVYEGLASQMSDIQGISWKITGQNAHLQTELSLKQEIKTAPDWKKSLLEQKLVHWQYFSLADGTLDVRNAAFSLAEAAEGATRINKVDVYEWSRKRRRELLSAIEMFEADIDPIAVKNLEEAAKCSSLTPQQVEQLRQFRQGYVQVQPEVAAIKKGIESTDSIDISSINSETRARLDSVSSLRSIITNTVHAIDNEIYARKLQETTPESLKPLVNQYSAYNEFAQVSDALDDISRDARDVLWITGGLYSKKERDIKLQDKSNDLLIRISNFKTLVDSAEKQQHLSQMANSKDLTAQQNAQLKEFCDGVQMLIPQIDQLESEVKLGAGKNFWKTSKAVREQMEACHDLGFKIVLASYDLHRHLDQELQTKK